MYNVIFLFTGAADLNSKDTGYRTSHSVWSKLYFLELDPNFLQYMF